MARQDELVKVSGRHVAGDHRTDVFGRYAGPRQRRTGCLDAQVGGRDVAKRATVVDHRGANAFVHPHVSKRIEKTFGCHDGDVQGVGLGLKPRVG